MAKRNMFNSEYRRKLDRDWMWSCLAGLVVALVIFGSMFYSFCIIAGTVKLPYLEN